MGLLSGALSVVGGMFGSGGGASVDQSILKREKARTKEEEDAYQELKRQEEEDRLALTQRSKGGRGGGRTGLMYGQNQQGVV